MQRIERVTVNRFLFAICFVFGLLALLSGNSDPYHDKINEIADLVETENDHVLPDSLAVWLMNEKPMRIIHLGDSSSYSRYHIPGAELKSLPDLLHSTLKKNELIILYSEGGIHAGQAWVLLKAKNFKNVYTMHGGLSAWRSEILFPRLSPDAKDAEKKRFEERSKISLYFGGQPTVILEPKPEVTMKKQEPPRKKIDTPRFEKEEEKIRDGC